MVRLKLNEGTNNGTSFIGLKAPNSVTSTTTFTLPDGDGSAGQFLKTDGSGNLDFATVNQFIDLAGDSGTDTYNTAETLTFWWFRYVNCCYRQYGNNKCNRH